MQWHATLRHWGGGGGGGGGGSSVKVNFVHFYHHVNHMIVDTGL